MTNQGWKVATAGLAGVVLTGVVGCQPRVVNAPASPPREMREGDGGSSAEGPVRPEEGTKAASASGGGKAREGVAVDRTITPTLDKERQAQADREAQTLSQRVGVRFEKIVLLEKPAWYAVDRVATPNSEGWMEYVGQGRGEKLGEAYDSAVRLARAGVTKRSSGAVGPMDVARAAYVRTETGEYVVWVLVRSK